MADLRQVVFSQIGHFHDGIAIESVLQHGARNIQSDSTVSGMISFKMLQAS
ncbi:hypothetical protein LO250_004213 [Salmonella enterica]|nr:hypothetical protein [Salmonella enterica]